MSTLKSTDVYGKNERSNEVTMAVASLFLLAAMVALIVGFSQRTEFKASATNILDAAQPPQSEAADPNKINLEVNAKLNPKKHANEARLAQLEQRFEQAVAMLHAKQYEYAVIALHRVLELSPKMPEAHVNMGYALLGLEKYGAARDFFNSATEIKAYQANAYWGLAVALDKLNEKEGALGAMRTYIHLAKADDPFVRKARSALWEWETTLKTGPLPKAEQEFIERGGRQWIERNGPEIDRPVATDRSVIISSSQ